MKGFCNFCVLFVYISLVGIGCGKSGALLTIRSAAPNAVTITNQTVYLFDIVVDSASTFNLPVPQITPGIIDSGSVMVFFKTSLVEPPAWFPLPNYTFPDGQQVVINLVGMRSGIIILQNAGPATPPMDYKVAVSLH